MQADRTNTEARAIDWLIRQRDPLFDDWDGFADWLAEDADHAAVFDAVASLDRDLAVIGAGSRAEIWDAEAWQRYLAEQESAFADIEEEVIPGMF